MYELYAAHLETISKTLNQKPLTALMRRVRLRTSTCGAGRGFKRLPQQRFQLAELEAVLFVQQHLQRFSQLRI